MARYNKQHDLRRQSAFYPGAIDPKTGNYTPSQADKAGVKQWPKTPEERERLRKFQQRP